MDHIFNSLCYSKRQLAIIALSDNYVIVSAPSANVSSGSGQAFVFNLSAGSLLYTFDNPNPVSTNDRFGGTTSTYHSPTMLAISDNFAIVGAPEENDASGNKSGKAYVFDLSDGSLAYTLDNPNPVGTSTEDYFGMAVALDDDFVIVGAPYEDDAVSNSYPGKAYIYSLTDGSLVRTLDDPNAFGTTDGDRFGHSVAIYDGIAIVSADREDDGSGTSSNSSGKVYIFNAGSESAAPSGPTPIWSLSGDSATFAAVTTSKLDTNATNYVALNHPTAMGNSWSIEDGSYAMLNNPNVVNDPTVANRAFNIWSTDDLSGGLTFQYWIKVKNTQPPVWEAQHGVTSGSTQAYSYSLSQSSATAWAWAGNGAYGYFGIPGNGRFDAAGWIHIAMELQSNGRFVHYINGVVASNEDASDLSGLTNKANIYFGSVHSWVTDIEIYTDGGIHNPDLLATPPGFTPPTRKQI